MSTEPVLYRIEPGTSSYKTATGLQGIFFTLVTGRLIEKIKLHAPEWDNKKGRSHWIEVTLLGRIFGVIADWGDDSAFLVEPRAGVLEGIITGLRDYRDEEYQLEIIGRKVRLMKVGGGIQVTLLDGPAIDEDLQDKLRELVEKNGAS